MQNQKICFSFKVLIKEMQSLSLDVKVMSEVGELDIKENIEDEVIGLEVNIEGEEAEAAAATDKPDEEIDFSNLSFDEMDVPDLDGLDDIEVDDIKIDDIKIEDVDKEDDDGISIDDIEIESLESLIEEDNAPTEDEEEND